MSQTVLVAGDRHARRRIAHHLLAAGTLTCDSSCAAPAHGHPASASSSSPCCRPAPPSSRVTSRTGAASSGYARGLTSCLGRPGRACSSGRRAGGAGGGGGGQRRTPLPALDLALDIFRATPGRAGPYACDGRRTNASRRRGSAVTRSRRLPRHVRRAAGRPQLDDAAGTAAFWGTGRRALRGDDGRRHGPLRSARRRDPHLPGGKLAVAVTGPRRADARGPRAGARPDGTSR